MSKKLGVALTDPIADMLTRIRNAIRAQHDVVLIPSSKTKVSIARILKREGFIGDFKNVDVQGHRYMKVTLRYLGPNRAAVSGLERVSRPGLRVYVGKGEIPRVYGGLGIAIVSTSGGVMTGYQAWRQGVGGELLCYIW